MLLSRLSGCIQPKERGGCQASGSPREQTPPLRPCALLVVVAPKAVLISSFWIFCSVRDANHPWHKFFLQKGTLLYLGYTQRFPAIFCFYRNISQFRSGLLLRGNKPQPLPLPPVHWHFRRPKQRLSRIALSQALGYRYSLFDLPKQLISSLQWNTLGCSCSRSKISGSLDERRLAN